ncbi:hypothetical protein ACFZ8E_07320 [Methylobacterium sp. HMF5984]|uniref:hypothetical protein n=1 Tax=Methylobacterium sp. HMF5984 TaxID=3367370 RepID=UPI0038521429
MPSYPIRPSFPIDVRSTPTVVVTREGTAFRFDTTGVGGTPGPSRSQFFGALEALTPGATAVLAAAVPSDPGDPINRAFNSTAFVTAGCALAAFVKATLGLSDAQLASVLAQAAALPN